MAATIGKVSAVFTSNTSGLKKGVSESVSALRRMEGQLSSLRSGLSGLTAIAGAQLFGQIASGALNAAKSLVSWGQSSAEAIDNMSKLAQRTGTTYAELAGLNLAADLAGVSTEKLAAAMTKSDRAFVMAAQGNKQATAAFDAIGLSIKDLEGLTPEQRFEKIADAIAELPDPAQRAAAAIGIFGRSGAELIPLFNSGSGAIREAAEMAERFGLALTDQQGTNVEAMNDSFTKARAAIEGIVQQVVANLAPAIQNVVDLFTEFVGTAGGANIGKDIGDAILAGALELAKIADSFVAQGSTLWEYVSQVGQQWSAVWDVASRVASFFSGVVNAFQTGLGAVIFGIGKVVEGLLSAASTIGSSLGFDTSGIDATLAGTKAFNQQIWSDMEANAAATVADFGAAFGERIEEAGQALPGPFEAAVRNGIAAAEEARNAISEAVPEEVTQRVVVEQANNQAVKGIDSRSAEGVREMFRLMRGGGGNIEERQLAVQEDIRDGIADLADGLGGEADFDVVEVGG